jgi:hypothetical protein
MRDHNDDHLTPELERAAQLLRSDEAVRPAWRASLLDEVARTPRDGQRSRGIHLSIPMAIAAGIICAIGGGAISYVATHRVNEAALSGSVALQPNVASTNSPLSNVTNTGATLPVRFTVAAPEAASVSIVGDFNHWNPTTLPMTRSADGTHWEVEVRLPLGRYSYAFLIDGRISPDPAAPQGAGDDFGAPNSVLMVRGS